MRRFTLLVLALATPAFAQEVALTPIPQDAATLDISGVWAYQTADHSHTGVCPPVPAKTGELRIDTAPAGTPVKVDILSGELCGKPMHLLAGGIEWGNLVVGNAAVVDDEGGQVFNAMVAYFYAADHGSGRVTSQYLHPGGMSCSWSYRVELTRP